jgi:hypothetical protein
MGDYKNLRLKHKLCIQEWLENGMNGTAAYMTYYPNCKRSTANNNFNQLKKTPAAQEYISEIVERQMKRTGITKDFILEEILELIKKAKSDDDRSSLLKALDMINKISGNYNQKSEIELTTNGIVMNFIQPSATPIGFTVNDPKKID